eukprot:365023-Chlamydomonas_euryale.AAC.5
MRPRSALSVTPIACDSRAAAVSVSGAAAGAPHWRHHGLRQLPGSWLPPATGCTVRHVDVEAAAGTVPRRLGRSAFTPSAGALARLQLVWHRPRRMKYQACNALMSGAADGLVVGLEGLIPPRLPTGESRPFPGRALRERLLAIQKGSFQVINAHLWKLAAAPMRKSSHRSKTNEKELTSFQGCGTNEKALTSLQDCGTNEKELTSFQDCGTNEKELTSLQGCGTNEKELTSLQGCGTGSKCSYHGASPAEALSNR